jgi:hypothetical protein
MYRHIGDHIVRFHGLDMMHEQIGDIFGNESAVLGVNNPSVRNFTKAIMFECLQSE